MICLKIKGAIQKIENINFKKLDEILGKPIILPFSNTITTVHLKTYYLYRSARLKKSPIGQDF